MAKLIVDISDKLHKELKMTALKQDKTLRELVIERLDVKILSVILSVILLSSITPAFADHRWEDVMDRAEKNGATDLEIYKMGQAHKAMIYQKTVMNFDYEKIQNKDPGFTGPVMTDVKEKKQIQRYQPSNLKY